MRRVTVARQLLVAAVLGALLGPLASPAEARYGGGNVDTYLVSPHGGTVGRMAVNADPTPTMTVRLLSPFSTARIKWVNVARGGNSGTYHLTFHGCATGGGVGFRFFLPDGREITGQVVHDGYTASVPHIGDHARVIVRVAWRAKRVERTCTLHGQGNIGTDQVNLHVITN